MTEDSLFQDVADAAESKNPLAEVFGFPTSNKSDRAASQELTVPELIVPVLEWPTAQVVVMAHR
jgi:hypothetical protein